MRRVNSLILAAIFAASMVCSSAPSFSENALISLQSSSEIPAYDRETQFGDWASRDGRNSRNSMLIRDSKVPPVMKGNKVVSGQWICPYTGRHMTDPLSVQIDHIVPLKNAWYSGASTWTKKRRRAYANDPDVLLCVYGRANEAKGDDGPDEWMPPNQEYWIEYLDQWEAIKTKYRLTYSPSERSAIDRYRAMMAPPVNDCVANTVATK